MDYDDIPLLDDGGGPFGYFRRLHADRLALMEEIAGTQADIVRMRLLVHVIIGANGPDVIYDVLVKNAHCFEKSSVLRTALYPLAGNGLFTSEGQLWRRQRKLMAPIFRFKSIRAYAATMAEYAERGVSRWRDGQVVDIARETTRIAMGVAGKTLFDADTFSDADELGNALTVALDWVNDQAASLVLIGQSQAKIALMRAAHQVPQPISGWCSRAADKLHRPIILPGARQRVLRAALDVLERRVDRMIQDRLTATEPADDLLSKLLSVRDGDDGTRMSHKQVRDEILTLFIAGHETTAAALGWSLYLLARHPDAYRAAQQEADAIAGDRIGFDDLSRLPYCLKVFKEALRMYPPIYLFGRQTIEPVELGGYHVPRGKIVLLSPYIVHHRPDIWPNPHRFDPERFTPEAEKARPREAYLPFSGGPRTCIGNHFSLMEGPIVLATLLRRATYTLIDDTPVVPEGAATLRPKGGIPMQIRLRDRRRTLYSVT